jgi:cytochrome c oxidase cbb3-type subunit 4
VEEAAVSGLDFGVAGALGTILAMTAFLGVVAWAWSRKRKADFDAAARLPLEEDAKGDNGAGGRQ